MIALVHKKRRQLTSSIVCKDVLTLIALGCALHFVAVFVVVIVINVSGTAINGDDVIGTHATGALEFKDIVFVTAAHLCFYLIGRRQLRLKLFQLLTTGQHNRECEKEGCYVGNFLQVTLTSTNKYTQSFTDCNTRMLIFAQIKRQN